MERFRFVSLFLLILFTGLIGQTYANSLVAVKGVSATNRVFAETDTADYEDPNLVPYRSSKSIFYHLFAIPAKIWRLAWTPIGATTIWMEQNRIPAKAIDFFLNDERTAGIFPIILFGGETPVAGGVSAFHNNLFDKGKRGSFFFVFGSADENRGSLSYSDSTLFGTSAFFKFSGEYLNDSDENFFVGGNAGDPDTSRRSYATELGHGEIHFGYAFGGQIGLGVATGLKRVDIGGGDGIGGGQSFLDTGVTGIGRTDLYNVATTLTLDFRQGIPRRISGTLFSFLYQYNRQLDGDDFEFNRFRAELSQYAPLPFLPWGRRLAVRGVLEKVDRFSGKAGVPFYELSVLGDAPDIRGYIRHRYRGRGALFFNFEYRFPVWDLWDGVVFVDVGQVYDSFSDITFDRFHTSIGTGFRFLSLEGLLARFEVAGSSEAIRVFFKFEPNF